MPAPALIQQSSLATGNGSATISLSGVLAGSTIILLISQYGSTTVRTYSAPDYSVAVQNNPGRQATILYRTNVPAGDHSITVSANTGTLAFEALAIEIGPSTFENASTWNSGSTTTVHYCAASGSIDSAADSFLVSGGVLHSAQTGGGTKHSSATLIYSNTFALWQYERSDAGFVDERHDWTTGGGRISVNSCATFVAATTGITASGTTTDAADVLVATGVLPIFSSGTATDASDSLVATAILPIQSMTTITDSADALVATAILPIITVGSTTDSADVLVATVVLPIVSSGTTTDANDSLVATVTLAGTGVNASGNSVDAADSLVATAVLPIVGVTTITEPAENLVATAVTTVLASTTAIDQPDGLFATVVVGIAASVEFSLFVSQFSTLESA